MRKSVIVVNVLFSGLNKALLFYRFLLKIKRPNKIKAYSLQWKLSMCLVMSYANTELTLINEQIMPNNYSK